MPAEPDDSYDGDPVARSLGLARDPQAYGTRVMSPLWRPEAVIFGSSIFIALAITAGLAHAWAWMGIGLVGLLYLPVAYVTDRRRRSGRRQAPDQ
jgi:hypothetical protein